jgi:hypothetical protein
MTMSDTNDSRQRLARPLCSALCWLLATVACSGCADRNASARTPRDGPSDERKLNIEIVESHYEQQAQGGALTSRTLYPHHFHYNSAALNALGERQIGRLMAGADQVPLQLHVARGSVADGIYQERLALVRDWLTVSGVEQIEFLDAPPMVAGMSSRRINRALQREHSASEQAVGARVDEIRTGGR